MLELLEGLKKIIMDRAAKPVQLHENQQEAALKCQACSSLI